VKGLLIIGGAAPDARLLGECRSGVELVAAADMGLETALGAGIEPDFVVGDMDSLRDPGLLARFPSDRLFIYPPDKDETDTEIGVRMLRHRGCTEISIAGGGGGRMDHFFAIAMLFERSAPPRRWLTDREDIWLVEGTQEHRGWLGSTVSVFPLGDHASGLRSEGLKWPLDGLTFRRGYGGVSNVAVGDPVRVSVGKGRLLLMRQFAGDRE
jgi:thiamine pyrophosphokinase